MYECMRDIQMVVKCGVGDGKGGNNTEIDIEREYELNVIKMKIRMRCDNVASAEHITIKCF